MKRAFLIVTIVLTFLISSTAFAASTGIWKSARNMSTPRFGHTATLLPNGKVLVVGGIDNSGYTSCNYLDSAELYNPVSNTWASAGKMSTAREGHTATLLQNGNVLVVGGGDNYNKTLNSAEIYNPTANSWTEASSMSIPRWSHTATLLQNGKVLVVGGCNQDTILSSAEVYDPTNDTWAKVADMSVVRTQHTATLLQNGNVLVVGGYGEDNGPLDSAEIFNPKTNLWAAVSDMSDARVSHTATLLQNGNVLVVGGIFHFYETEGLLSAEIYDPKNNKWSKAGDMKTARVFSTATLLQNGEVLVTGGDEGQETNDGIELLNSPELYNSSTNTWTAATNMITARDGHTATLLSSDKVLVAGGNGNDGSLNSAEIYDPSTIAPSTSPFTGNLQQKLQNAIALYVRQSKTFVNSDQTEIDRTNASVYPFIQEGRTLVPVRFISESLGAKVDWNGDTSTVNISLKGKTASMKINSKKISVDGVESNLEVPAQIVNGRTFIPIRALVEALDKQLFWDDRGLIVISDNAKLFDPVADKGLVDEIVGVFKND